MTIARRWSPGWRVDLLEDARPKRPDADEAELEDIGAGYPHGAQPDRAEPHPRCIEVEPRKGP
jgi:hypothetical protein